jgi:hypothetical protein
MNVSDQLQQIGIFLAEDGFITILEEMSLPPSPCQTRGLGFLYDLSKPFKEVIPVKVIPKDSPLLNFPDNNVVLSPQGVNS